MSFFSDKVCQPRHTLQYLFSNLWMRPKENCAQPDRVIPISEHYSFEIFQRVEDLQPIWDEQLADQNIFLQTSFLSALQASPPVGVQNRFLVIYQDGRPVGATLLQLVEYRLKESLKDLAGGALKGWRQQLRYQAAGVLNFQLLVVGNLLLSGEHGFVFDESQLSKQEGIQLILEAMPLIKRSLERMEGHKLSGLLMKDLTSPLTAKEQQSLMHQVTFQPCMQISLRADWGSMENYLADLQSKYRVRAKRAFKKLDGVQIREWDLAKIVAKQQSIYALYRAVADKATFNMLSLQPNYFAALKEELGERFRFFAYEDPAGEFLGFCTLIQNGSEYDAHFLGLNETANRQRQLYLNMLFNMLQHAIEHPAINSITFGRTALEIKSSIGAKAQAMYCYIKHFNPVFNLIIGWLIRKYDPVEEWQPRHPFKTKATAEV